MISNTAKRVLCLLAAVCLLAACCVTVSADEKTLTNIALGQYIEATSTYHPPEEFFHENYLVDGDWNTYPDSPHIGWNTNTVGDPVYEDTVVDIVLYLDHAYKVEKIVLKPMQWSCGKAFPRDYQLQASPDGISWTDVASAKDMNVEAESNTAVKPVTYEIEPTAMKYFRMHITRNSANTDPSGMTTSALGELELWGYACDDSELPTPPARSYTATFVAGNQTVAKVEFKTGDKTVAEPAVPEKEGYTGAWAPYTLKDADVVIRAVYTPIDENATEAPTDAPATDAATEAPVTEAPATEAPTDAATEAPAADTAVTEPADTAAESATEADASGCASVMPLGMLALVLPAAFVFGRRKH